MDTIIAYKTGDRYTFEFPTDPNGPIRLVTVRLVAGAWLERMTSGETVVCTHAYRFGVRLMTAIGLGLCTVDELNVDDLRALIPRRRSQMRSQPGA